MCKNGLGMHTSGGTLPGPPKTYGVRTQRTAVGNVREPRMTKTLLHVLIASKPHLEKELFAKLLCKVQIKVRQRHKIKLPAQLAFPYSLTNDCVLTSLRKKLKMGLQALGLPKYILEYLLHVTWFVGERGPSVAHILGTKTLKQKWATLERLGRSACTCAEDHFVATIIILTRHRR